MILSLLAYFVLALGLGLSLLLVVAKARGAFRYWVRPHQTREFWAVGRTLPHTAGRDQTQAALADANAALRSLEHRSNQVVRQWDYQSGELFIGVVVTQKLEDDILSDFEQRHFASRQTVRLSGQNRENEDTPLQVIKSYSAQKSLKLDHNHPIMLSGQSFRLYQWDLLEANNELSNSHWNNLLEWVAQLRDNLALPILLTIISLGLLGMRDPVLFAIGVGLMVLLSGACKFVLIHQRSDEADEVHLQNY